MLNTIITTTPVTGSVFAICMIASILLGVLNSLVFSFRSEHSRSFSLTLALLPMTICIVIMMVNGNIGAGVAVAGAFTLVRFRSIPGTAKEIAAIFTAMAIGLTVGMGYIGISVIFFVLDAILVIVLTVINFGSSSVTDKQLRITLPENFDYNGLFDETFAKYTKKAELIRIRTTNMGTLYELTYRVALPNQEIPKDFIDEIRSKNGNLNVILGDFEWHEVL
jgi:uncharacterized membrane protein YhiD involved in acid resistance